MRTIYADVYQDIKAIVYELAEIDNDGNLIYEDFWKLMSNDSNDPLNENLPSDFNKFDVINKRIKVLPKRDTVVNEEMTYITFNLETTKKAGSNNIYQKDIWIDVKVVSHLNCMEIIEENGTDGALNPNRLFYILDTLEHVLKGTEVSGIRPSLNEQSPFRQFRAGEDYFGYTGTFSYTKNVMNCGLGN